ncbi:MAG: hypothetical protein SGJ21_04115 [Alphaproteobacteria bacterium]|nr:hypothetical protein [Alphaproteobacteria bacterium]
MKRLVLAVTAALLCAPALAQEAAPASDTIQAVTTKGVSLEVQGQAFNIDYTPDGKFTGGDGMFGGTWKADGSKLCISLPDMGVENQCTVYPDGKKSGDTFEITGEMGAMNVTIR